MKKDIYERVTDKIIAELEKGVRPWVRPWNGEHAAGRITRPLRANGVPYRGINVVMLWAEAVEKGYGRQETVSRLPAPASHARLHSAG